MPNIAVLSRQDWEAIKLASVKGVPDKTLATQYDILANTIHKRRERDPIWHAAWTSRMSKPVHVDIKRAAEGVKEAVEASLEDIRAENPLIVARYTHDLIKDSVKNRTIAAPQSLSELKTATEIVRKAVGLDKDVGQVTLNMWGGQGHFDEEREVSAVQDATYSLADESPVQDPEDVEWG